ncbi:PDZ domain-containing protein [Rugosimonospora acidiphila]|uniref:endopeptidase La n=1 Tax=Rugosimonospora acidiphila TaxID=556531 RepID=A0ABP9RPK6_9ACTN
MRRRGATLLVGVVVLVALVLGSFVGIKVPYVEEGPGPTWNTLGSSSGKQLISISGGTTSNSAGQLRMVTVGVEDQITLWQAIRGWLDPSDAVVPREVVYPPDQTQQQTDQQNQQEFAESQSSAETAALRKLGFPVKVTVGSVVAGAPAEGHLRAGDVINSVNGQQVTSVEKLTSLIKARPAGTALVIGYSRNGVPASTTITSSKGSDGSPQVGVQVDQKQPSPYSIKFTLDDVGGPSAGLMFSLGIVDKLTPTDLTGGMTIAGTGTIDDDGNVGPIGGIAQKMRGAKRDGATVFLSPADNCAEAVANAVPGLELVKVSTLNDALTALQKLRDHQTPTLCAGS